MGNELIPKEIIEHKIYLIRGHKVMLDRDLAKLYKVSTGRLNELERKTEKHGANIQVIFDAIRKLMAPLPLKPKPQIGFKPDR